MSLNDFVRAGTIKETRAVASARRLADETGALDLVIRVGIDLDGPPRAHHGDLSTGGFQKLATDRYYFVLVD